MAVLNGLAEAGGGLLLVVGLLTPLAGAAVIGVMLNATLAVHWKNGFWNRKGGWEFPMMNAAAAAALAFAGAGRYSIDRALGWNLSGPLWGGAAVAFGVAVGLALYGWRGVVQSRRAVIPEKGPAGRRAA